MEMESIFREEGEASEWRSQRFTKGYPRKLKVPTRLFFSVGKFGENGFPMVNTIPFFSRSGRHDALKKCRVVGGYPEKCRVFGVPAKCHPPNGCGSKLNHQGDHRFWSMLPLTRASHFGVTNSF